MAKNETMERCGYIWVKPHPENKVELWETQRDSLWFHMYRYEEDVDEEPFYQCFVRLAGQRAIGEGKHSTFERALQEALVDAIYMLAYEAQCLGKKENHEER